MTLKEFYNKHNNTIDKAVAGALKEDNVFNDISTKLILKGKRADKIIKAELLCKENCIIAGLDIFKKVFLSIDKNVKFKTFFKDGDFVRNSLTVLEVRSSLKNLLIGERTALNFIQRMSGIATLTSYFVKRLRFKDAKILHTRKTTPNFRVFEIAAVKTGGGDFYRFNLNSSVMIKDNHAAASGSVANALKKLRKYGAALKNSVAEVKSFDEISQVMKYGRGVIKTVMLDNFNQKELKMAVKLLKNHGFKIEISGGINKRNFRYVQMKGVDFYSIGMLTHSYKSVDFSFEF